MAQSSNWNVDLLSARVLLVNDDGIDAPGMAVLEKVMRPLCAELWVVAPEQEQSGTSHAFSIHRPVRLREAGERRFAVDGLPADATIMGLGVVMAEGPPDIVISGVNRGANIGDDTTYSGTVGAAMEAALVGVPAIAISADRKAPNEPHWDAVEAHLPDTLVWLLAEDWPTGSILNINFPNVPAAAVRGKRVTRLGRRKPGGEIMTGVDPMGKPFYWIGTKRVVGNVTADSDIQAAEDGFISMTPLRFDLTDDALLARAKERLSS
ncbi:MAG: 5'/3'-nucleotidase SurE [Alphaproteobacteria bacterium]